MQGLHHHHQQLAVLLSAATGESPAPPSSSAEEAESGRIAAVTTLHRSVIYPPNSLLVSHSASFLAQGFSKLLSDKSYAVRHAAATAYGAFCSVLCSILMSSNGRQNHVLGGLIDRFINWALPLLRNIRTGDGATELALQALREFINVGDVSAIERYALPILKASQELLEDERTSLSLLHQLLGVLTLISLKFFRFFQPHFVDIVDLLLGWVMLPDLTDSDRRVIMDSFLQFQKHWVNGLPFSLGLLSKFLGDMDVQLKDGSAGSPQQFQRLLALLSCFCTVLQSTACGLLEINLLEQIIEPLSQMIPLLFGCLSMVGRKFGWAKWISDSWRCLTLLAEILSERFSNFYPLAVDVLFQSLEMENKEVPGKVTSFHVHGVLKTNLQLLSLQKLGLLASSVHKILQFNSPISQLRLHPNHLVTGSCAATYIFLLQHRNNDVVEQAVDSLIKEIELILGMLERTLVNGEEVRNAVGSRSYSEPELLAMIKFDLKVLLSCISVGGNAARVVGPEFDALYLKRSERLASFIMEKLDPFGSSIQSFLELQTSVIQTLGHLTLFQVFKKFSIRKQSNQKKSENVTVEAIGVKDNSKDRLPFRIFNHLKKYTDLLTKALHVSSPLAVKLQAFSWIYEFCEGVIDAYENIDDANYPFEAFGYVNVIGNLVTSVLNAALDREPKVRFHVASALESLLQAKLIHPPHFYAISVLVLEKLGDPDDSIRNAFMKILSQVLPITVYTCDLHDPGNISTRGTNIFSESSNLHWRQVFALKQVSQQLQSQQLVSILSFLSQRWKVPLSSWIQRLIHTRRSSKNVPVNQVEEGGDNGIDGLGLDVRFDEDILEKVSTVNILAGAWWAIYEAARYCITTRLRTNLGGPTQTFAALERMLLDVAHVLRLDAEQSDGTLNLVGFSHAHLLPMRLLLEFVEALKKNVYNAYEGSIVLPCAARQSLLFFRANRKVCEEWFSRICEPMMNAGLTLQCHHATIHYCTLRLQELKNHAVSSRKDKPRGQIDNKSRYSEDILRVVRHMALSLCKVHEPEALIGLRKWATMTFSSLLLDENHNVGGDEDLGPFAWISGLVYQAKGQHEMAAAHFTHLLQEEESLSLMGSDGVQFVIARVIESYSAISDWKSLDSWLSNLHTLRAKHSGKGYSGALTASGNEINAIHALARFDEGDYQAARRYLDLTPKSSSELTLDPELAFQRSEQMLLQALLLHAEGKLDKVPQEIQKAKSMLDEALSVLPMDGLDEAAAHATQLYCISAFEESLKIEGSREKQSHSLLSSYIQVLQYPINEVRQECNMWLKVLRVHRSISPASQVTLKLSKNLSRLARKQGNLSLANTLSNNVRDLVTSCPEVNNRDFLTRTLQYESILLMHAENKLEDAFSNLWSFLRPCFVSSLSTVSNAQDAFLNAKACLKLSNWLGTHYSNANLENIIMTLLAEFNTSDTSSLGGGATNPADDGFCSKPNVSVVVEELIGTATKLSSQLCPSLGKSWISYASWCYNHARASMSSPNEAISQSCSLTSILGPELIPDRFKLSEGEMLKVTSIVLQLLRRKTETENLNIESRESKDRQDSLDDMSNENLENALVQQVVGIIEAAAGAPGAESSSGERLSCLVTSQLQKCLQFANVIVDKSFLLSSVDELVDIWWALRRRRLSLFGHAAQGFINYLSYSSSMHPEGNLAASFCEFLNKKTASYTHRATLYVLDILVNFGVELKETLEPALSVAPLLPWQEITPQIFARVSAHPEPVVRKLLEGLLLVVAKLSPWSIVYPTLVDVNSSEGQPSEELQKILACLSKLYPRFIQGVQLVIKELENVTVLWEELWLSTLQDLHGDVMRRINLLKEEALRVEDNVTLTQSEKNRINAAKYSAMMAPIIVALERRLTSTSKKPETPHEIWFHEEYMEQIKSSIAKFRTPPLSPAAIGDVWRPFSNIATSLASFQRKASISLGEVAPHLAQLASSDVPMPGLERQIIIAESDGGFTNPDGIVTIASFGEQVSVLPTKTKPKKLVILGSDGQKYKYLLKGREDLRLDARIMQLLQIINGCLHSSRETRRKSLSIRYYSVTPISGRAGLIQWVDNVTSIYSIFKSWQSRAQLAQFQALGAANTKNSVPPPVPRPSDMFYGKIIPALKEKGIRKVISRRDWPHEVKRKVFLDLMNEVPEQLLHQELWCASEGFKAFNSKLRRFSGSVAAMSMVGYILGLGDRHLDNILIDFSSGDILHIDYNVCFDKGQRLKIPEIVPFRLTRTMEAALGLTGIEGIFRADCEAVLGVLKKNKDIVLMLLEVFAWDPLVEWTRGDFPDDAAIVGEERKGMEVAVSLSLFASRVQEIRVPLQEHHDLLLGNLPSVESALENFASILDQYELVSVIFHHTDQEMSNLVMHETSAKSLVSEATSNFENFRASYETQAREFAQAKSLIADKAQEVTNWMEQHGRLLDTLRSSSIPDIKTYLQLKGTEEAFSLTSAVVGAGVPLNVVPEPTQAQCHDIDREVSQLIAELDHGLNSVVQALQTYSLALQRILPQNYLTTSPMHGWAQVLQLSVNNPTPDVLSFSLRQAAELIAEVHNDGFDTRKGSYNSLCIKVEKYAEEIDKLEREYVELMNSISSENRKISKDRLLSAFVKYLQSNGLEEKKEKIATFLNVAVSSLYGTVKHKVFEILNHLSVVRSIVYMQQSDVGATFSEFEEQVERCVLVAGFVKDLQQIISGDLTSSNIDADSSNYLSPTNWASIFRTILLSCKNLVGQMIEVVLPDVLSSVVSFSSEVMDTFGSISQVIGSIDKALKQTVEVELEKASLVELEKNYFLNVGLVTEQQLALKEAAMKGRDHLSWEEAEEIASQEEACRTQLDQLHQTWNQKDVRDSSLLKRESSIRSALLSSESHFQSLISVDQEIENRDSRRRSLLVALDKPFSELESSDNELTSIGGHDASFGLGVPGLQDLISSGYPISGFTWKFPNLMNRQSFFMWKVGIMNILLESCIHDAALSVEKNLGFDQLLNVVKKKVEIHLREHVHQYLKGRVGPILLARLDKEIEFLKQWTDTANESSFGQQNKDLAPERRIQLMLEEYCNSHETVRAAKSAALIMERRVNELKEGLRKTSLEVFAMEWMHDVPLNPLHNVRLISHKFLASEDNLISVILNLNRPQLLDTMRSSVSKIIGALNGLKACERTSVTAEGQLERAMGWACGGSNSSGIPPEFHNHLMRRRQLFLEAHGKSSDIINMCMSILEFETSRDGLLLTSTEVYSFRASADGRQWHQDYLNVLTRLDAAYHSLTRTEQDLKLSQSSVEAASNALFSVTNELSVASAKAKPASGDMQNTLLAMRDCAYESSVALSAFACLSRSHTALTSESGSMLEEVLAITEGLHDIHRMGKEAAEVHCSLMKDLSKASEILLPLEAVLTKDVAAMTDAMAREKETKMQISPIHGQAIYQSYYSRIKEASQRFKPLVAPLTVSVKELHSLLTTLARAASLHAGNLHKALEGLGESQVVGSQDLNLSRPIIAAHDNDYDSKEGDVSSRIETESQEGVVGAGVLSIQDKGWISAPNSISDSSSDSGSTSADLNSGDDNDPENEINRLRAGLNSEEVVHNEQSEVRDLETVKGDTDSVGEYVKPEESQQDIDSPSVVETSKCLNQESTQVQVELKDDSIPPSQDKCDDKDQVNPDPSGGVGIRVFRGKNPFAMSVLKRVEMKIDGRGISENRAIGIADQVDFLLKQATSVDNLCSMYEGWTPWI